MELFREIFSKELLLSPEGRVSRSMYWKFFGVYLVIYIVAILIDLVTGTLNPHTGVGLFSSIFSLLALYPSIVVSIKRCHDRNRSGWFLLVCCIPILNIWPLVELGFLKGTPGENRFGPEPE